MSISPDTVDIDPERIDEILADRRKFAVDEPDQRVSAEECAAWRQAYAEEGSYTAIATDTDVARSTVRYHVAGDCRHGSER